MAYRQLVITFHENGDVEYDFSRHNAEYRLSRYLIEYPAQKVIIHGGQNLHTDNFQSKTTSEGFLLLTWDRVPGGVREVRYTKVGFMNVIQETPRLLHYQETIRIKAEPAHGDSHGIFSLRLHDRNQRLSAIKAKSNADFYSHSEGIVPSCNSILRSRRLECSEHKVNAYSHTNLRPTELADAHFQCSGILTVDWILEIDETK